MLFTSEKVHIEIDFLEWCREHKKAPTFELFLGFLEDNGCLDESAVKRIFEEFFGR
jgi:hypothetical protein